MKRITGLAVPSVVREGLWCFGAFLIIFMLSHSGYDDSEAVYQYMVAKQIVTAHALGFAEPQRGIFKKGPNGRTYAAHEIGNTLCMLPLAWLNVQLERELTARFGEPKVRLLTRFLTASLSWVYAAAGLAFIFVLLRCFFGQTLPLALTNVLILGLCSFYWTYSREPFDGVLCAAILCGATLLLFLYSRSRDTRMLVWGFCLLGFGFISRITMAIPIAAAFVYLTWILRADWKGLARVAALAVFVLLPFLVWQGYYNHLRTGNAFIAAFQTYQDNGLTGDLLTHAPGLLISPGKGIFVYAPPVLLAVFCFPAFFRGYRAEALYIAMIGFVWWLTHAKLAGNWHGTFGWGPRHFITITPVVAIPFLVCGWEVFRSFAKMTFARICLCFGLLLAVASIVGNEHYRLEFANLQGRIADRYIVWSLTENQAVDMIRSSSSHVARVFVNVPWDIVPGASAMDQRASNTVNVWLVTAYHEGVPAIIVALTAILLLSLLTCCFWFLLKSPTTGERVSVEHQ